MASSSNRFMVLAARYVELSNKKELSTIFKMFSPTAIYRSVGVGDHQGLPDIQQMMTSFFALRSDITWVVEKLYIRDEDIENVVTFDFTATHTDDDGNRVLRKGVETIEFDTTSDLINSLEVEKIEVISVAPPEL